MFHCPSRRAATPYPSTFARSSNAIEPPLVAKADYAGSGSSQLFQQPGPPFSYLRAYPRCDSDRADIGLLEHDGLTTALSKVQGQQISDGTSNTSMRAEKFLNPDHVEIGKCGGDNNSVYNASDRDINRRVPARVDDSDQLDQQTVVRRMPAVDSVSIDVSIDPFASRRFGSAYAAGINAAYTDGSVHTVQYEIDPDVYYA